MKHLLGARLLDVLLTLTTNVRLICKDLPGTNRIFMNTVFSKNHIRELRNISSEGCCIQTHDNYDEVICLANRSMQFFFVDGIKYIRIYDPDTDRFFIQPVPRGGSDFFASELEGFRRLHCEPVIKIYV